MTRSSTIQRIESQGLRLESLAPDLCSHFEAVRLTRARIIWINRRWFKDVLGEEESGIDWELICAWILEEFAFCVPGPQDSSLHFTSDHRRFFADRYGDDALSPHGGSGRVGASGFFQVKGIGPTPLVGVDADWLHNHGCMWLEEGIREALVGELLHRSSPVGVVPVIALIDTGIDASFTLDSPDHRRVLAVRPSFLRPAHFQRAPMFAPISGDRLDAQFADARRTRQMAHLLLRHESLIQFIDASASQAANAYVQRIYLGGMLGSNWSFDGRLVDFGGITGVESWSRMEVTPGLPIFGSETLALEQTLEALTVRGSDFSGDGQWMTPTDVQDRFRRSVASELARLASANSLPRDSILVSNDGTLSSRIDPASLPRLKFDRRIVQKAIWEDTSNPDANSIEHIEGLIEGWVERLTMHFPVKW